MIEKVPEQKTENQNANIFENADILDEKEYYRACVEYALDIGWVKPKEKDELIEKYLKPIYQEYRTIIEQVKREMASDPDKDFGTTVEKIIKKLNLILERTKRIGSTEPNNIIRSIGDFYNFSCRKDEYTEYAADSLYWFIVRILNK